MTPDGMEDAADAQWPAWRPPADRASADRDGYGGIARYVTPDALHAFDSAFPPGQRSRLDDRPGAPADRSAVDHALFRALYEQLVSRDIPYDAPPWNPSEGQRLRDPEWMLKRRGSGTCLDFALLFAALCLREELHVELVMLRGEQTAHAAVALRPGNDGPWCSAGLPGVVTTETKGVLKVVDRDAVLRSPDIVLLDVTAAVAPAALPYDEAVARMRPHLAAPELDTLHLVDVRRRQKMGDFPLPAPVRQGALRLVLPPPTVRRWTPYPGHQDALEKLGAVESGVVVLCGPQGVGKSTVALEAARRRDHGFGWFLPAASRQALQNALARRYLFEIGHEVAQIEAPERGPLAASARQLLRDTADPWVVVLDNADRGPGTVRDMLHAGAGQLLIVTSTAPAADWAGLPVVEMEPLTDEELAEGAAGDPDLQHVVDDPVLRHLVAGTTLFIEAFAALLRHRPDVTIDPMWIDGPPTTEKAASAYVSVLLPLLDSDAERRMAQSMAWLPPDRMEASAVAVLHPEAVRVLGRLLDVGLVAQRNADTVTLHRLFGAALRRSIDRTEADEIATGLLARDAVRANLLRHADEMVTSQLEDALADTGSGVALAALGALLEIHRPPGSTPTFARAEKLLHPDEDPTHATPLAHCLHARARVVNQNRGAKGPEIDEAIRVMDRAIGLRTDDTVGIAQHEALKALLLKQAAKRLPLGHPERLPRLLEVNAILEDSWARRRAALGDDDPLVERAYYNLAGVRIELAKTEPAAAAAHLDVADSVYDHTIRFRDRFYAKPNPLLASAVAGRATVAYFRAAMDLGPTPTGTLLDVAMQNAVDSLRMRLQLSNQGDVRKSARLVVKIGALQARRHGEDIWDVFREAVTEIPRLERGEPVEA